MPYQSPLAAEDKARRFAEILVYEHPGNYSKSYEQMLNEFNVEHSNIKSSIRCAASRFAQKPEVQEWIALFRKEAREQFQIDKEEIVANLKEISFNEDNFKKDRIAAMKLLVDMGGLKTTNVNVDAQQTLEIVIE